MSGLQLTYDGLSVTFLKFSSRNWPRDRIDTPEISRTAYGTPTIRGYAFEAPHIWQVSAELSDVKASAAVLSDAETMDAIFDLWQQQGGELLLNDYSREFTEKTTRTRALATGTTARTVGSIIKYFAQFNAQFEGAMTRAIQSNQTVLFEFTLLETTKVLAA